MMSEKKTVKPKKAAAGAAGHTTGKILKKDLTIDDLLEVRSLLEGKLLEKKDTNVQYPDGSVKIDDVPTQDAINRINEIVKGLVNQIENTGRGSFAIPTRSANNIIYDEVNDLLLLGKKSAMKSLLSLTSVVDATRLMRVLELIYQLLEKDIHATKREIFYGDVNLFTDQKFSDTCIEDASTLLRTTRNSTHVVASAKGSAIGRLRIRDRNDIIDLESLGSGGWTISPMLDNIEVLESDAEFILVLEKDAAMIRLSEARWWKKFPCIILTGKGAADMATRMFLKRINKELKLPTFCLVDSDPYGHYIYSVYLRGSKRLSYESPFLATPNMHLLGVLSRDLAEYSIPDNCRIPMNKADLKRLDELMNEDFVLNNANWKGDLELMKKLKVKAEIQALSSHGFEYLTETYLPNKLESADWI
jgi:meiotic recombination protein SPO11